MKPLHQILPALLRKQPRRASAPAAPATSSAGNFDDLFAEDLIRSAWTHLAGRQLAARTRPLRIYRGRLVVEVPERSWARQLRRFEGALLDRVNRLLGERRVNDVEWHANPALDGAAPPSPPRKPPVREKMRQEDASDASLHAAAQAIGDPELRELFLRTARKMAR